MNQHIFKFVSLGNLEYHYFFEEAGIFLVPILKLLYLSLSSCNFSVSYHWFKDI